MSSPGFRFAIAFVLQVEGGGAYVEDDAGHGPTRWGINSAAHPGVDVKTLTEAGAADIYRSAYWDALALDTLPVRLAVAVCDGAVNHGPKTSAVMLQRAVGVDADGVIGPVTAQAAKHPDALRRYLVARAMRYAQHPQFQTYGAAWLRRLQECQAYCEGLPD